MGLIKIDQAGRPAGTPGQSRTDGLDDGTLVTLENVDPSGFTQFRLLWAPPEDSSAVATLAPTRGSPDIWEFAPSPACYGTYLVELLEDGVSIEVRVFGVRTPLKRLLIPALNEKASKFASLVNDGPDQTALSENNATDFGDAALDAVAYAGWWRSQAELYRAVEAAAASFSATFPASATWIVNHNFGRHPYSWSVETLGGVEIEVAVQHVTVNQSVVSFDSPTAGVVKFT